jgi:nucleolar protein 58
MLILVDTPAGYTLWRVTNEGALEQTDLCSVYPTPDDATSILSFHDIRPFDSVEEAVRALSALSQSEMDPTLESFLTDSVVNAGIHESLHVADTSLARQIERLGISCIAPPGSEVPEIFRLIRSNIPALVPGLDEATLRTLELGVAHGMATQTLKFSPSKIDSMIVHSVHLLEELDKEVNNYGMRVREWYGWHFPELRTITSDNLLFAQIVLAIGRKEGCLTAKLDHLLNPPQIEEIQRNAKRSVGTEISDDDLACIQSLAGQVVELLEFRNQIFEYIRQRMKAIAPNLTELVGETVGARLIAHAGSLNQLAKAAASTIQVFGAEKALFRALKEEKKTPKYGILYHAQIVSHADQKLKGPLSRSLAAKAALSSRTDAFGDEPTDKYGIEDRERLETRVRQLQGHAVSYGVSRSAVKEVPQRPIIEHVPNYKVDADFQLDEEQPKPKRRRKHHHEEEPVPE